MTNWPVKGMRMARKLGMLSYRSSEEWRTRFGRRKQDYFPTELFGMNYEVESYLEAAARRFVRSFDPCSYLYLSRAMDWFDVADDYPDLPTALAGIKLKTACVIGVETDILFPAYQQKEIADALRSNGIDTSFSNLESLMGHDAFLVDHDHFNPHVVAYFDRIWFETTLTLNNEYHKKQICDLNTGIARPANIYFAPRKSCRSGEIGRRAGFKIQFW